MKTLLMSAFLRFGGIMRSSVLVTSSILFCTVAQAQYADGYYPKSKELPTMPNEEIGKVSYNLYQRAMECIDGMGSDSLKGYMSAEWCSKYIEWERNMKNEIRYAVIKAGFSKEDANCITILNANVRRQFSLAIFDNGGQSNEFPNRKTADATSMHIVPQVEPCVERIGKYV